jgi:glycosyltransferase involved in cell wall biosynthesis
MRIFAFHDGAACAYYRVLLPLGEMAKHDHEIEFSHGWTDRARDYRIISGQRIGNTNALPIWRRLAAQHRLVYEIDDDVWSVDPTNYNAHRVHSLDIIDAMEHAAHVANLVIVSTDTLAEVLGKHNPNVIVIPNHVDGELLSVDRIQRDRLVVGWAGGDSHIRDISLIAAPLRRFLRRNPQAEFHNMGTDFTRVLKVPGRTTGWAQDMWDYYRNVDFDIGLAPLVDSTFNQSKSAIKCLEYAALGIPVIASNVGPYRQFVLDGVTGFLVRSEHEWGRRLYELSQDEPMRVEMGVKARELASQWTVQNGWRRWESALATL